MIAKRVLNFDSSLVRQAFERASDIPDPIDFSIGYPEDNTPDYIKAAGIQAINNNFTRYTPSNGIFELRAAVAEKLTRENNIVTHPDLVTITPGLTTGILLTYLSILDPGDEILIPDPYFPPYVELARMVGAHPILVDTYPSFQLTAAQLESRITDRTKAVLINSPNNPSGAIYPERELRKIAKLAKKYDLIILSDEIYEYFAYDTAHFSIGSIYNKTVTLNGFSKAYAMTGWRIGYITGPAAIIEAINQLQQYTVFASSSIAQKAAIAALRYTPTRLTQKYKSKRDTTLKYLEPVFDVYGSEGAFYTFVQLPSGIDDITFCKQAAAKGVVVLPSRAFSTHTDYIRIAFASNHRTLVKGLKIIRSVAEELVRNETSVQKIIAK